MSGVRNMVYFTIYFGDALLWIRADDFLGSGASIVPSSRVNHQSVCISPQLTDYPVDVLGNPLTPIHSDLRELIVDVERAIHAAARLIASSSIDSADR